MTIRAISLDWGDTLAANYGMPYKAVQQRAFDGLVQDLARAGGQVPNDAVASWWPALQEVWDRTVDPAQNPENREFDYEALIDGWLADCGLDREQAATAVVTYGQVITDTVIAFAGVGEALAALKARGLRVGICSHVPWPGDACRAWYERQGWAKYIDFWSLSCEVGWIKPARAHYEHTLAAAGCAADEVLHVGDHPLRDVQGGHDFGFRTALKETQGIYDQALLDACPADARILHINELTAVVDRLDGESIP
jgi:FMN phosphatase YigB (HAD superfamily)